MKHMSQSVQPSATCLKSLLSTPSSSASPAASIRSNRVGEGIAQVEAQAAAVTDVEHPAQLGVERGIVVPGLVLPRNGMTDRRLQAAFGHGSRFGYRNWVRE